MDKNQALVGAVLAALLVAAVFLAQQGNPVVFPNATKPPNATEPAQLPAIEVTYSMGSGWTGWYKSITIKDNGSVYVEEQPGVGAGEGLEGAKVNRSYALTDSEILEFKRLVNDADVFSFNDTYNCEPDCPTDYPSSSIRFVVGGKEKAISMYVPQDMPPALVQVLDKIGEILARFEVAAGLDESFQLRAGQAAVVGYGDVVIKFLNVTGDSRCPLEVKCVWAGQATVVVSIAKGGQEPSILSLAISGGYEPEPAMERFDKYIIKLFRVEPYPWAGRTITLSEYVITLQLSIAA